MGFTIFVIARFIGNYYPFFKIYFIPLVIVSALTFPSTCPLISKVSDSIDPLTEPVSAIVMSDTNTFPFVSPETSIEPPEIAKLYNMLQVDIEGSSKGRTAMDNKTVRTVFIVGPDKRIKLFLTYPMTTGRNFHELLRTIDSMQRTAKHKIDLMIS